MMERIRLFLDRHFLLDILVHFSVMAVGIVSLSLPLLQLPISKIFFLWINALVLFLLLWNHYIRPSKKERETKLEFLFDILRWLNGVVLLIWASFGLGRRGRELAPALWRLPGKDAVIVIMQGVAFFILWQGLYYLSKRYQWGVKKSLGVSRRSSKKYRK